MSDHHPNPSPLAGETVTIIGGRGEPVEYRVEDWWDRVTGGSWMTAEGNPAALSYAIHSGVTGLPIDNEVLYGKVGPFGKLVHISEVRSAA